MLELQAALGGGGWPWVTGLPARSRPCSDQAYPSVGIHRKGGRSILAAGPPPSFLPWGATCLGRQVHPCDSDIL